MKTYIRLDDRLLNEAKKLSHIQSTEEVIQQALERYVVGLQSSQQLLDLRGKVEFWEDDDTPQTHLD